MTLYKCDRCGETIRNAEHLYADHVLIDGVTTIDLDRSGRFDLCPDCRKRLLEWLEEKKK